MAWKAYAVTRRCQLRSARSFLLARNRRAARAALVAWRDGRRGRAEAARRLWALGRACRTAALREGLRRLGESARKKERHETVSWWRGEGGGRWMEGYRCVRFAVIANGVVDGVNLLVCVRVVCGFLPCGLWLCGKTAAKLRSHPICMYVAAPSPLHPMYYRHHRHRRLTTTTSIPHK